MNMFTPPECEDFTYFRTVLENVFWLETLLVPEKQKFIKSTTDNKEKLALREGREIKGNFHQTRCRRELPTRSEGASTATSVHFDNR